MYHYSEGFEGGKECWCRFSLPQLLLVLQYSEHAIVSYCRLGAVGRRWPRRKRIALRNEAGRCALVVFIVFGAGWNAERRLHWVWRVDARARHWWSSFLSGSCAVPWLVLWFDMPQRQPIKSAIKD